jgi:hypothetical protein
MWPVSAIMGTVKLMDFTGLVVHENGAGKSFW